MEHLYEKLAEYAAGPDYPLHMPGHKRRTFGEMPQDLLRIDITEIDGFDNLHAPEGILKELQTRAALLYGAEESFCLIGGSTCGILSAVSAALPMGGKLLMARNCHKSAYHAAYLRKLRLSYLYPEVSEEFELPEAVTPQQVQEALEKESDTDAVLIVSPTYEGRIAKVREIAGIVHRFGKILIVDEAHGAHLGLYPQKPESPGNAPGSLGEGNLPENSCQAGADLVIHSLHKTLPAMTQTALLHVNGPRVDRERLRRFLRIYQSSSPSYPLMASVDNAIALIEREGQELFRTFHQAFYEMMLALQSCASLKFLASHPSKEPGVFQDADRQDIGKLVIGCRNGSLTGQEIYDRLRERFHLQPEMAAGKYCLAMFTVGDTPEGYRRMTQALLELDHECQKICPRQGGKETAIREEQNAAAVDNCPEIETGCEFAQAWDMPWEELPLREAPGRMAAEFVNLYPPGVPILVPGERFTEEICKQLERLHGQGLNLQGVTGPLPELVVKCIIEKAGGKR